SRRTLPGAPLAREHGGDRAADELDRLRVVGVRQRAREAVEPGVLERLRLFGELVRIADQRELAPLGRDQLGELALGLLMRAAGDEDAVARLGDLRRVAADGLAVALEHAHQVPDA